MWTLVVLYVVIDLVVQIMALGIHLGRDYPHQPKVVTAGQAVILFVLRIGFIIFAGYALYQHFYP